MHTSINLPSDPYSLAPFENAEALRDFYTRFGCDGIELILCGEDFGGKIRPGMVRGLHLVFYPEWIALWRDDFAYLDREFGSRAAWQAFYNAKNSAGLLDIYRNELRVARRLGAEYVVFHVGDNPLDEYFTLSQRRSDAEIFAESAALLNTLFSEEDYAFTLLLENMWLGSMNLVDPDGTRQMLEGVRYENTGLMLDTGHLMVTNPRLRDGEEACEYIHKVLDAHGDIAKKIYGVHLQQSLSGEYFKGFSRSAAHLHGSYVDRYIQAGEHLRQIDPHNAFVARGVPQLLQRIAPRYVVYELSRADMPEWEAKLRAQQQVFAQG